MIFEGFVSGVDFSDGIPYGSSFLIVFFDGLFGRLDFFADGIIGSQAGLQALVGFVEPGANLGAKFGDVGQPLFDFGRIGEEVDTVTQDGYAGLGLCEMIE